VERLTNLIDVVYTIGNFDQELPISVIFSTFAYLRKYEKKYTIFVKKPIASDYFPCRKYVQPFSLP